MSTGTLAGQFDEDRDGDRDDPDVACEPAPAKAPPSGLIRDGTVGVTRRFGTVRVLGLLPVFALMFGLMQWLGAPPSMFVGVTLFVLLVGAGQAVLFGGRTPRQASFVAGLIAGPVVALLMVLLATRIDGPREVNDPMSVYVLAGLLGFLGGPLGYLAGGLMAGVFLVRGRDLDDESGSLGAAVEPPADPLDG